MPSRPMEGTFYFMKLARYKNIFFTCYINFFSCYVSGITVKSLSESASSLSADGKARLISLKGTDEYFTDYENLLKTFIKQSIKRKFGAFSRMKEIETSHVTVG